MASIEFAGFVYDSAGAAISGATVNLYDRNTTTPVRATTTTNASGYWTISHATEGRFDIEIVNGTTVRRIKYDSAMQSQEIEVANLLVRNPANTFKYDVVPAAITADRTLNLPLITATDTIATLGNTISREGGQTTEGTTTSTSEVDLITASSLTLDVQRALATYLARKTTGAANSVSAGLKLNTTVIRSAFAISGSTNEAQSGFINAWFSVNITNYLGGLRFTVSGRGATDNWNATQIADANLPAAAVTDIVTRALVADALITQGHDEMHVYAFGLTTA